MISTGCKRRYTVYPSISLVVAGPTTPAWCYLLLLLRLLLLLQLPPLHQASSEYTWKHCYHCFKGKLPIKITDIAGICYYNTTYLYVLIYLTNLLRRKSIIKCYTLVNFLFYIPVKLPNEGRARTKRSNFVLYMVIRI